MKKITLLSVILVLFCTNSIFSQNTAIPGLSFNSTADVANWTFSPTTVSRQWFNGNCVAMFVDNLPNSQQVGIMGPIFNIPTSGNYELEIRDGLPNSNTTVLYELVTSPGGNIIAPSSGSILSGSCTSWPNAKIKKLNFMGFTAGNYRLRITLPNNAQLFIEGIKSNVNYSTMSINAVTTSLDFKIYPNPNNGSFFLASNNSEQSIRSLQIFSLQGKLLFDQKITSSNQEIKTDALSAGIYLLKLESENGAVLHEKLVIR